MRATRISRLTAVLLLPAVLLMIAFVSCRPRAALLRASQGLDAAPLAGGSPAATGSSGVAAASAAPEPGAGKPGAGKAGTGDPGAADSGTGAPGAGGPTRLASRQLADALGRLFGPDDSYSVATLDLTTDRSCLLGAGGGMVAASSIKLNLLSTLLHQHQLSGRPLTQSQHRDARAMMVRSDNAAADRIWRAVGGNAGLRRHHAVLGLRDTVLDADGRWGLSTTSARDQLLLLQALTSTGSPLSAVSRQYALALMGGVQSDQRWGVSAAGDPGSAPVLKNGWLGVDSDGGRWVANSAGVLRVGGHRVLMVVLSQHQPDHPTAVARVRQAAIALAACR